MYRVALAVAVLVASAAVFASTALADQPNRVPVGNGDFVVSGVCAFDVQATLLADNEFATTFSNGATIITGRLVYRLTNLTSDKSIVINISGPGIFSDTKSVLLGNSLLFGFTSPSGMFLTRGLVTLDLTNGSFIATSAATVDLCAALA